MATFDIRRPSTGFQANNQPIQELFLNCRLGHLEVGDEFRISGTDNWIPVFPARAAQMRSHFPAQVPIQPNSADVNSPGGQLCHVDDGMISASDLNAVEEGVREPVDSGEVEPKYIVRCSDGREDGVFVRWQIEGLFEDGILTSKYHLQSTGDPECRWKTSSQAGFGCSPRFLVQWPGGRIDGPFTARRIAGMTKARLLSGACTFRLENTSGPWRPHPEVLQTDGELSRDEYGDASIQTGSGDRWSEDRELLYVFRDRGGNESRPMNRLGLRALISEGKVEPGCSVKFVDGAIWHEVTKLAIHGIRR